MNNKFLKKTQLIKKSVKAQQIINKKIIIVEEIANFQIINKKIQNKRNHCKNKKTMKIQILRNILKIIKIKVLKLKRKINNNQFICKKI